MSAQEQNGQPIQLFINAPSVPQTQPKTEPLKKPKQEEKAGTISKKTIAFEMYDRITAKKQQAIIGIIGVVLTMLTGAVSMKISAVVGLIVCGILAFSMRGDVAFLKDLEQRYNIKPRQGLF